MGLFSSSADKYSPTRHPLPGEDFKRIFRSLQISSLTKDEEKLAEIELNKLRSPDGKISPRAVYKVLRHLRNINKISKSDERNLLKAFEEYFNTL